MPKRNPRPIVQGQTSSGFPSPAEDYEEQPLNLHDLVITNPPATYFMRADTDLLRSSSIQPGDIMVVDRSLAPTDGCLVIAVIRDAFHVKMCRLSDGVIRLVDDQNSSEADPEDIWGVVTYITRKV